MIVGSSDIQRFYSKYIAIEHEDLSPDIVPSNKLPIRIVHHMTGS
jgi:hypothetical protein